MGSGFWTDESWRQACRQCPCLEGVVPYLPPRTTSFEGRERVLQLASSYREHQYDLLFYGLVRALRPTCCVEAGVLEGFSLCATAAALRDNAHGHVTAYDLFDRYPYRHAVQSGVAATCADAGLQPYVTLQEADVNDAPPRHACVDLLHVDISNDGDIYRDQFARWAGRVTGVILLEGGSAERDDVRWMKTYGRAATREAVEDLRRRYDDWRFAVLAPFPSVTVAVRVPRFTPEGR